MRGIRKTQERVRALRTLEWCLWALAVLAPASWLVLSKAHSDVHSHLIPVLFQYSAVPASLALAGALAAAVLRAARGVRRA